MDNDTKVKTKFRFVDFAARYQKGFRNHLVDIQEVPSLVHQFQTIDCFTTYFFYPDDVLKYVSARPEAGEPLITGYSGKLRAPFLPLDLDSTEPEETLAVSRRISRTLIEDWKAPLEGLRIFFSGARGFHLMLDIRLFGRIVPSDRLGRVFSVLRHDLVQQTGCHDASVVDFMVMDAVRLLRLPNTVNGKSNLYKIYLTYLELMNLSMDQILERAEEPGALPSGDPTGLVSTQRIQPCATLVELFQRTNDRLPRAVLK